MRFLIVLIFVLLALRAERHGDDLGFYAGLIIASIWIEGA